MEYKESGRVDMVETQADTSERVRAKEEEAKRLEKLEKKLQRLERNMAKAEKRIEGLKKKVRAIKRRERKRRRFERFVMRFIEDSAVDGFGDDGYHRFRSEKKNGDSNRKYLTGWEDGFSEEETQRGRKDDFKSDKVAGVGLYPTIRLRTIFVIFIFAGFAFMVFEYGTVRLGKKMVSLYTEKMSGEYLTSASPGGDFDEVNGSKKTVRGERGSSSSADGKMERKVEGTSSVGRSGVDAGKEEKPSPLLNRGEHSINTEGSKKVAREGGRSHRGVETERCRVEKRVGSGGVTAGVKLGKQSDLVDGSDGKLLGGKEEDRTFVLPQGWNKKMSSPEEGLGGSATTGNEGSSGKKEEGANSSKKEAGDSRKGNPHGDLTGGSARDSASKE